MEKPWYVKVWKMRKYGDLWSVNHTLAGGILACLFMFFNAPFLAALAISFFILLGWEFYEITHNVHETIYNRISDMIVGMAGFLIVYYLVSNGFIANVRIFSWIFGAFIVLEIWGFTVFEEVKNGKLKSNKN